MSSNPEAISDEEVDYKTSIVFTSGDKPGDLFKALSVFALRDLDLTKIENRPIPQFIVESLDHEELFQNLFYVDFKGSLKEEAKRQKGEARAEKQKDTSHLSGTLPPAKKQCRAGGVSVLPACEY